MAFGMPRVDHGNRYYLGIDENNAYNLISGSKKLKSSYGLKNGTPPVEMAMSGAGLRWAIHLEL